MQLSDFQFELPEDLIAQAPLPERDASRMLILNREKWSWEDSTFRSFPDLLRGDELLVVNNARVIPARLLGRREGVRSEEPGRNRRTAREFLSSPIEVLLTRQVAPGEWEALVRPGRKMRVGERVDFGNGDLTAEVVSRGEYGMRRIRLTAKGDVTEAIERLGHVPLPPYISREDQPADRERYQTIFADNPGAVAAPTAGLPFFPRDSGAAAAARHRDGLDHAGCRPGHIPAHPRRADRPAPDSFRALRNFRSRGRGDLQGAPRWAPDSSRGDHRGAHARRCRGEIRCTPWRKLEPGDIPGRARRRGSQSVHQARPHVSRGRSTLDEFSFAAIHTSHSGERVRRARIHSASVPARRRCPLPLLQLWGLHVDCVELQVVGHAWRLVGHSHFFRTKVVTCLRFKTQGRATQRSNSGIPS